MRAGLRGRAGIGRRSSIVGAAAMVGAGVVAAAVVAAATVVGAAVGRQVFPQCVSDERTTESIDDADLFQFFHILRGNFRFISDIDYVNFSIIFVGRYKVLW